VRLRDGVRQIHLTQPPTGLFTEDENKATRYVYLQAHLSVCELQINRHFEIYRDYFLDEHGRR
jgi:hypothetical protein